MIQRHIDMELTRVKEELVRMASLAESAIGLAVKALVSRDAQLARQVTSFIQELRRADLYKVPGVAETLDWTTALVALDRQALDPGIVEETLGVILKYQDDVEKIRGEQTKAILERVRVGS